jgi:hypothetical protein
MAMSNPRAQAAHVAHSDSIEPIRRTEGDPEGKADHYGYVARVLRRGVDGLINDPSTVSTIQDASTPKGLRDLLFGAVYHHIGEAWQATAEDLRAHLDASQSHRAKTDVRKWRTVDETLFAGSSTYATSVHGFYGRLKDAFGQDIASLPSNAALLNRIAQLNMDAFMPYYGVYLDDNEQLRDNGAAFKDQFELRADGTLAFKKDFPGKALVPVNAAKDKGIWSTSDFLVEGSELITLDDIPQTSVAIGCPFTFDLPQGRALWELYATTRRRIDRDLELGTAALSTLGDTEGSDQATASPAQASSHQ